MMVIAADSREPLQGESMRAITGRGRPGREPSAALPSLTDAPIDAPHAAVHSWFDGNLDDRVLAEPRLIAAAREATRDFALQAKSENT